MVRTLQDPATPKGMDINLTAFQLRPELLTGEKLAEVERLEMGLAQKIQDREDRIVRFDGRLASSKLESYRKKYRLTQSKMAKMMEVSKRSYCDYESGETPIPFQALQKLAESTDIDFNDLIVGDTSRTRTEYCRHVIQQTRIIVAYCLRGKSQLTGAEAFAVADRYAIEYGFYGDLGIIGPETNMARIDDCIRTVTFDPEAEGLFE